jgi:hypothetical protein
VNISKGDLVLVKGLKNTYTCVILSENYSMGSGSRFYYSYCIETDVYGVIYNNEIISVVTKGFNFDHEFNSELFDDEYTWYEMMMETHSYWPYFYAPTEDDDDPKIKPVDPDEDDE